MTETQEGETNEKFRRRNGRPEFVKISSLPDVMIRPDQRSIIKTFTNLSATTHHVRQHPRAEKDRTMHNLRAIISPTAVKPTVGKNQGHESLHALPPFTMVESDSEGSKSHAWSPRKQPKKSCMKHSSDHSPPLHDSTGYLEAPSYSRHAMAKKKESRWNASKPDGVAKGDPPPSPFKTPKRMESVDLDDFSLPSLSTYHTDDLTLGTTSTPSSRRERNHSPAIPEESTSSRNSTKLERKLEKAKRDPFMSPPATKDILMETSWTRKDITKSISDSSPQAIGEELLSAVVSLSDHSNQLVKMVPLSSDNYSHGSEREQATLSSMQESASTILRSNVSSEKKDKRQRRSRSGSKSRASRIEEKREPSKQRGRSVSKEKTRKSGKSVERKGANHYRRERSKEPGKSSRSVSLSKHCSETSTHSDSATKSTKSRSDPSKRRAFSRSASPKRYGTALPAPSKKYLSKSRSKSKSRSESPRRRSRASAKSRSASPTRDRTGLKSHSRHKSRSASPERRRSESGTAKKRSKSRSESPKRVRSKSRSMSLKTKEAKDVIGDSTHKKAKKRSSSLRTGSKGAKPKRGTWENALVPIAGLLPPKNPIKADTAASNKGS